MYCSKCGNIINDEQESCQYCGTPTNVNAQVISQQPSTKAPYTALPMGWYRFLINFSLFASAVLYIISAVIYFTGYQYNVGINQNIQQLVYEAFPGMQFWDYFIGVCYIAFAVFAIFVRFRLSGYKKNAPKLITILYICGILCTIIFNVGIIIFTDGEVGFNSSDISTIISNVVMISINRSYFNKRAHVFVN